MITILCWVLWVLDAFLALFSLVFIYLKNPSSGIAFSLMIFVLMCLGAIVWSDQLKNAGHAVSPVIVASIPAILGAAVALLLYFSLKNMRMF